MTMPQLLAYALVLLHAPAFGQLLGPGSANPMTSYSIDRTNEGIRAREAEESRRQEEYQRSAERERRNRDNAEREYTAKREVARAEIRALPDAPDKQQQLDKFACMYPASATLPPGQQAIDDCMAELRQNRERAARDAAASAIAEQASKARQELEAAQALRAEQERKEAQRKAEEASAAAAISAKQAAEAETRARIISPITVLIGLAGIVALAVYRRKAKWAAVFVAAFMGVLSGFLLYLMAAMALGGRTTSISTTFVLVTFFGGWALSMYFLLKGAFSVSKVLSRGFLLGAAEWLLMIPVGLLFAGRAVTDTVAASDGSSATHVGAAIGGGFVAFITGGVSIAMAVFCLIAFAVTYFMTREMKPEEPAALIATPPAPEFNRAAFAEEFIKLAKLKEQGALSETEFATMKSALINRAKADATT